MKEFFIKDDGIKLHCKLDFPADSQDAGPDHKIPLLILIHGFTGHMEEPHIVAVQKTANDTGMAVLRAEMYGHGMSGGEFPKHTLYKWVTNGLAVIEYARSLDFVSDLYIAGHSQGGCLVMLLAGMHPNTFKGVIPMSPAWMIPEAARNGSLLGVSFDPDHIPDRIHMGEKYIEGDYIRVAQTLHVEDEIARYHGSVLIIHGDKDEAVPYYYGVKAAELYEHAKLITIPGDTHCYDYHLDQVTAAISEFLKEHD